MNTRNLLYLFAIILLIAPGCKKDNNDAPQQPDDDFTPIPSAATLNTTITTYVASTNSGNADVSIGLYNGAYSNGGYTKAGAFDQHNTYISTGHQSGSKFFGGFRFIPVSNSSRNYVDVAGQEELFISNVSTGNGSGYFPLPNGGKISYPNNGFGSTNSYITLATIITDPTSPTFIISNPTVAVDLDNQRWYLRSYGAFLFQFDIPLMTGKFAELEYPIPANQLANAPDSIEAYHLEQSVQWVKRGVAKKQGNVYKYTLPADGSWCFGVRQKGIYKTFQVRTATGIPVINAILRIKNGTTDIGEARTDADGNAICFIPVGETFALTIPPSWTLPNMPSSLTTTVGPFNFASNTPQFINYPTDTKQLRIIKGKATNCDGTPVKKGTITVMRHFGSFDYCHIPVVDGQYSGAVVKDQYIDPLVCVVKLNSGTGSQTKDTAIAWDPGVEKTINLNTCPTPTNLYMDYTVDGVNYSIKGDVSNQHVTFDHGSPEDIISAADGSKTFQFIVPSSFSWPGTHPTGFSWVYINNVNVPNCLGTLTFSRYDLIPGGYMEGSFDMSYYENSGVKHEIKGKFRAYRAI